MQDRSYAFALVLVLAICIIGMYVAVSGFWNSTPQTTYPRVPVATAAGTMVVMVADTETPALRPTIPVIPSEIASAVPSPLGPGQSFTWTVTEADALLVTPSATISPSPAPVPTLAPAVPTPAGVNAPCGGQPFCASGGPPDPQLAPTGDRCPRNYIWGRVSDVAGNGIIGIKVAFRIPYAGVGTAETKGPPDPAGTFNIVTSPPGGPWAVWVVDGSGKRVSPEITIQAPQTYSGTGNCPTRVDFRAQR